MPQQILLRAVAPAFLVDMPLAMELGAKAALPAPISFSPELNRKAAASLAALDLILSLDLPYARLALQAVISQALAVLATLHV